MNAAIFDANLHNCTRGKSTKRPTFGYGCQRSRPQEAGDRFGGRAKASFSTPLGRIAFLVVTS